MPLVLSGTSGISTNGTNWALQPTSAGYNVSPNQPSFRVGRNAGAVSAGNVVVYNVVYHNVGSHYNTSNGRFTAPVTGKYFIGVNIFTAVNTSSQVYIRINGTFVQYSLGYGAQYMMMTTSNIFSMNANDYLDVYVNTGTAYADGSPYDCTFTGMLIG